MSSPSAEDFMNICMAVPRRYKNYNEQMQAEMEKMYGSENPPGYVSKPTYVKDDAPRPRYVEETEKVEKESAEIPDVRQSKVHMTVMGRPVTDESPESVKVFAGLFMVAFGFIYTFIATFIGVLAFDDAPMEVLPFISIFIIVGIAVMIGGIRMILRSRKKQ